MKKKFDFSAEMSEAESIRSTPKNEYLEEENHLLDINVQELAGKTGGDWDSAPEEAGTLLMRQS